jgi:hypothetical protein
MSYDHTEFEHGGFKCIIASDDDAESPEEWGNTDGFLGELNARRYKKMGREGETAAEARRCIPWGEGPWEWSQDNNGSLGLDMDTWFDDEQDMRQVWETEWHTGYKVFPVRLADYGSNGAALHLSDHDEAHGYIFIEVPWASELERLAHPEFDAQKIADCILSEWNQYLEGDVHWARIEDSDGETLDSCGGFYGREGAEEWCRETAEASEKETRTVSVVVTHGSLPLPFPASVSGDVLQIEVPLSVGDDSVPKWATTEGPFSNDPDVLQVNLYTPIARTA